MVPVWYRHDGDCIHVWSDESRLWVRNLRRDPRCALVVHEHEPPYAAALLRGTAEIATGDDAWIAEEARRITQRYIDAGAVDGYLRTWAGLRTIVTIVPQSRSAWGRGY